MKRFLSWLVIVAILVIVAWTRTQAQVLTPAAPSSCSVFKQVDATAAGNTAIWTPTTGKKFLLMKFYVGISGSTILGVAGNEAVTFQDSATGLPFRIDVQVPTVAVTGEDFSSGWIDLGAGYLSTTVNNVLNVNLGTAVTGGPGVTVMACGLEQ